MKNLIVGVLMAVSLLVPVEKVLACSCVSTTALEALKSSDAVFVGTVTDIQTVETKITSMFGDVSPEELKALGEMGKVRVEVVTLAITFQVSGYWKGDAKRVVTVYVTTESYPPGVSVLNTCGGFTFKLGSEYLVFGRQNKNGRLGTDTGVCSKTVPIPTSRASNTFEELGAPQKPQ